METGVRLSCMCSGVPFCYNTWHTHARNASVLDPSCCAIFVWAALMGSSAALSPYLHAAVRCSLPQQPWTRLVAACLLSMPHTQGRLLHMFFLLIPGAYHQVRCAAVPHGFAAFCMALPRAVFRSGLHGRVALPFDSGCAHITVLFRAWILLPCPSFQHFFCALRL